MMDITKGINKWTEDKFEAIDYGKDKHPFAKAFGLGVIEGAVDSAFMIGAGVIVCTVWKFINSDK